MKKFLLLFVAFLLAFSIKQSVAQSYHLLSSGPLTQDWTNTGLITTNDDWSGITSIIGYRGDTSTSITNVDPRILVSASYNLVIDVNANQLVPNTNTSGGVTEFEITDPVVALQGSGTADAPNLVVFLNTTSCSNINIKFNVKDIDGSADNSVQQFVLQYRIGASGDFVTLPESYIADASEGPSLASLITNVDITLPAVCNNQEKVEVRFITTNAAGSDEWIGIDDINITATTSSTPTITVSSPSTGVQWAQGSEQTYTWTAIGTNSNVKIEFTANASDVTPTWNEINPGIAANAGTWTSLIPADQAIGNDYQIRITDIPQTAVGLSGIFSIIAAPAPIATFNPTNGMTGVDNTSNITITFDVPVRNIDNSEITDANVGMLLTLTTTDALGTPVPFTATIDASKKVITINPDADLAFEQLYYVAINPVEGLSDNATIAENISFTTAASIVSTISDVIITEVVPYFAGDAITITWISSNVTEVMIEAWIPSESKWEVLFASTPSDGTELFTIPSDAQYSTAYKIRVTDAANPAVRDSSSAFTVIAVVDNLLALRAQPANAMVKYSGIATVTYARTSRNQKYIQDATAAILIDDPTPAPGFITGTYAIGDGITNIVGKILFFNQLMEFTPLSITGEPATGIEIVPEVRTLESLKPADQSKLIKIENFAFKTPTQFDVDGKFVAPKSYDIEGIDKAVMVYRTAFAESDYIGGYVPVGPISSVVLVGQFNTLMQISARSWSDMTVPTVAEFDATPTFVIEGESVQFNDMSTNNPISWEWTFAGGTPATSIEQNPLIQYNADGLYSVTLKVTNASGGNNTVTKTDFITVGGVGFPTLASDASVYPNPSNGKLFIANPAKEKQEIVVFNSVGKRLNSFVSAEGIIPLNIIEQAKGMYMVRITNNATKSVRFKKIILN